MLAPWLPSRRIFPYWLCLGVLSLEGLHLGGTDADSLLSHMGPQWPLISVLHSSNSCWRIWVWGMATLGCQFDTSGKKEPQLINCPHQIGLWSFSWSLIYVGGPSPVWAVSSLNMWWTLHGRRLKVSLGAAQWAVSLCGSCFRLLVVCDPMLSGTHFGSCHSSNNKQTRTGFKPSLFLCDTPAYVWSSPLSWTYSPDVLSPHSYSDRSFVWSESDLSIY